ncbi:MAG: inorganic phosphate transporter family protein [Thermoplasmata archaeon]|nr:inorganic phosphate transporter family protein [Thermoplasmata archaeon]
MVDLADLVLIGLAIGFALSIGAHYTGACMGLPYAAGAIRGRTALLVMAPLSFVGAIVASETVEGTVGHGLLAVPAGGILLATEIIAVAFGLVSAYNYLRLPTSTIQILVFSVVGVGLGTGLVVHWATVESLLVLWATAPILCLAVAFVLVRSADTLRPPQPTRNVTRGTQLGRSAVVGLVGVGAAASFVMGANDVSNATGGFIMTGLFDPVTAAALGGVGLALGVLLWGRPLLERVAFDIVDLDPRLATGAQLSQAGVVLGATVFGLFTSLNQALVGAMVGAGLARHTRTVHWPMVRGILVGWGVGPVSGIVVGFAVARLAGVFGIPG